MIIVSFFCFSLSLISEEKAPAKNKEETPTYQTVKPVIDGAILAIEAKDTEKFFKEYVSPSDIKAQKEKEGTYEKATSEFMASEKAGSLLFVLKKLKDMKPIYYKEKELLVFKEDQTILITFSRENGQWYIKN